MVRKGACVILTLGVLGCCLLAIRHARLQAASEAAQAQLRIRTADDELCRVRATIAAATTPARIESLARESGLGALRPATNDLPIELTTEAANDDTAEVGAHAEKLVEARE